MTVDLEDWFHILDNKDTVLESQWLKLEPRIHENTDRLLKLLHKHNQKATFFILGWIAKQYPSLIQKICSNGHDIACHSNLHQLVYTQTPEVFERDLVNALDEIENACGERPTAYRAPGFSITKNSTWALEILAKQGIIVDCSIFPSNRAHGGISSFPIASPCRIKISNGAELKCLPMNTITILGKRVVFSGGGYFRLTPQTLLRHFFKNEPYVMTYFHPRDFDPDQPMVPGISKYRQFKSYVGLNTAHDKLDCILGENNFITVSDSVAQLDWPNFPEIYI